MYGKGRYLYQSHGWYGSPKYESHKLFLGRFPYERLSSHLVLKAEISKAATIEPSTGWTLDQPQNLINHLEDRLSKWLKTHGDGVWLVSTYRCTSNFLNYINIY